MKIISTGLLFNGKLSYLRSDENVIDFVVTIISVLSIVITSGKLKVVKVFRLVRVLRPLRIITKNKGLKIAIQALFMAVPSIINVLIVTVLFYIIFGIIGVNYFKGTFFYCNFSNGFDMSVLTVTKYDCLNYGGEWVN